MTITTISADDRLKLIGLLTLAADHRLALDAIERAACRITGDARNAGQLHQRRGVDGLKRAIG